MPGDDEEENALDEALKQYSMGRTTAGRHPQQQQQQTMAGHHGRAHHHYQMPLPVHHQQQQQGAHHAHLHHGMASTKEASLEDADADHAPMTLLKQTQSGALFIPSGNSRRRVLYRRTTFAAAR